MTDIEFNRNEDWMKLANSAVKKQKEKIWLGGGKKAIEKQHQKNKLTPRERIDYLIDKGRQFLELGTFAGWDLIDVVLRWDYYDKNHNIPQFFCS